MKLPALAACLLFGLLLQAQDRSIDPDIFKKIAAASKDYIPDTSAVPDDRLTRKIIEFKNLRGGFNINEAILFKFQEEEAKAMDSASKAGIQSMSKAFFMGNGQRWLDNAIIHIYRSEFTYREMKQLVRFYRTAAGQKLASQLPFVIVRSVLAAEAVQKALAPH